MSALAEHLDPFAHVLGSGRGLGADEPGSELLLAVEEYAAETLTRLDVRSDGLRVTQTCDEGIVRFEWACELSSGQLLACFARTPNGSRSSVTLDAQAQSSVWLIGPPPVDKTSAYRFEVTVGGAVTFEVLITTRQLDELDRLLRALGPAQRPRPRIRVPG